jgi:L-malate glycosyltransferase
VPWRAVCLLLPSFTEGDACGNDVAQMYELLTAMGVECHIFLEHRAENISLPTHWIREYPLFTAEQQTLTIYHHATGWETGVRVLLAAPGAKVVRYHNVTPAQFFRPYSPRFTELALTGEAETEMLARDPGIDLYLGASAYNIRELVRLGAAEAKCRVVYPLHKVAEFERTKADVGVLQNFLDDHFNLVFVGRTSPNKGHRHLIRVLAHCRERWGRGVRLILVGGRDPYLDSYYAELEELVRDRGLQEAVVFTGKVSFAALKAYYLLAHVFLVMSEHEGFCIPLVEAMSQRVPIVAYATAAVPETQGDHPLLLNTLQPEAYVHAMELLSDRAFAAGVVQKQTERLRSTFTLEHICYQFLQAIMPLLS